MPSPAAPHGIDVPIQFLKGIGPRRSAVLEKAGIKTVADLLFYVPRRYLDRTAVVNIGQLRRLVVDRNSVLPSAGGEEESAADVRRDLTVLGKVRSFRVMGYGARSRFVLILNDDTGSLQCVWFGGVQYWRKAFQIGETLAVSGQPTLYGGVVQFVHPDLDRIAPAEDGDQEPGGEGEGVSSAGETVDWTATLNTGGLIPLYPSSKELAQVGLDSAGFRRAVSAALRRHIDDVVETLPQSLLAKRNLVPLRQAIQTAHFPRTSEELGDAFRRLKFEEFFFFQVKLALQRTLLRKNTKGIAFNVKSSHARRLVDLLPFSLTGAQVKVIREISSDMEAGRPMNRLLQGDVGSGKTIVALVAMLIAVESGYQSVFMAPTELLAEQHYGTLTALLRDIPVTTRLLVGAQKASVRRDILEDIREGSAQILVGTHALFEKGVDFAHLGLVVIDEQHRFGVIQRSMLRQKGDNPDVLVMTATPIPRTLSLTLYGDLDVSILDELPKDRKPVRTILRHDEEREEVYRFVREQIRLGQQAYFVYPLIEESEKLDLKAAVVYFQHLQEETFPGLRLGLIHGRLAPEERDRVMGEFKRCELDILVATTVIEVGIDIPNASLMVIEDAERFGLSQLHQLRGRVGRGSEQSYCILLAKKWVALRASRMGDPTRQRLDLDQQRLAERRLAAMVQTTDGFRIAEMDLQLRGPGDFFGTRQSGIPEFKVANILTDTGILHEARADAFDIIERDAHLRLPEHRSIADYVHAHFRDELSLLLAG